MCANLPPHLAHGILSWIHNPSSRVFLHELSSEELIMPTRCINAGIGEIVGSGYHVYDMQMMKTDESQLMVSRGSHTK